MSPPIKHVNLPEKKLVLSDIVDNAKINNTNSFLDDAKLESLQEWIREQIKIYNK
jgi:hypothetical protein